MNKNHTNTFYPLYVLKKLHSGEIIAKFLGASITNNKTKAIWVPKTLVTNMKGPKDIWVPKTKA